MCPTYQENTDVVNAVLTPAAALMSTLLGWGVQSGRRPGCWTDATTHWRRISSPPFEDANEKEDKPASPWQQSLHCAGYHEAGGICPTLVGEKKE